MSFWDWYITKNNHKRYEETRLKMSGTIPLRELILFDEEELSDMWDEESDELALKKIERAIDIRVDIDYQKMNIRNEIEDLREELMEEEDRRIRRALRREIAALEASLERVENEILAEHGIDVTSDEDNIDTSKDDNDMSIEYNED